QVDSIRVNDSLVTDDLNYYTLGNTIDSTYSRQNVISLGIDESSPYFIQSDLDVTITFQITVTSAAGTDSVFSRAFRINYKKADSAKNGILSYYAFNNAYKVKLKITSITTANSM